MTTHKRIWRRRGKLSIRVSATDHHANGGWYRTEDSKGTRYSPYRIFRHKYFPLPDDREAACDLLNNNQEWELHHSGKLANHDDYQELIADGVRLPEGVYFHENSLYGDEESLRSLNLRDDRFVRVPHLSGQIISDVRRYLASEDTYRKMGAQYRLGILLYGSPGNGKTLLIRDLIRNELPEDSVVMFWNELPSTSFLQAVHRTLKDRLKVIVFEELIAIVNRSHIEKLLDFLDGETSLDKTLVFATTNYPEQLPGNIVDRPSRFDKVYVIGEPDAESRKIILAFFLGRSPTATEIEITRGFSSADLKETVLLNQIQGITFQDAVHRIKAHRKLVKRQFAKRTPIGIYQDLDF